MYSEPARGINSMPQLDVPSARRKLLLVDDDSELRASLAEILQNRFVIHLASDGAEAWHVLSASPERFLILPDHRMPNMTGSALLRRACASPVKTAGAILMSGDANL